ncbi:MAG TPA: protein kinase [Polyangiaceae bacterium]|nr:protein kinase [Polyangiaceae bacterium]
MPSILPTSRFHEIASLGVGGMGGVNLAVSIGPAGFTKLLVVKRLRPEIADIPEFLSMFLQEAKLSARLNHPNIVQTYEISADATSHFLTMEYLEGQSLQAVLRASRSGHPLSNSFLRDGVPASGPQSGSGPRHSPAVREAEFTGKHRLMLPYYLRALADALEGLHYAHELCDHDGMPLNIVHRDVSPGNIFITYDGTVKLLDFGIAKAADSSLHTRTGMLKGKVAFMAPEQLRQGSAIDRRVDLFAVGVMLWEAAAGRRLWRGVSDLEILMRLSKGQIPRPGELAPDVHPRLEAICNKAMAFEPDERYPTAEALQDDIEDLLDEIGPVSSRELGAYVSDLFAPQRTEARAFVRRKLDELRAAYAGDEFGPPSARSVRAFDSSREGVVPAAPPPSREDSRIGPSPLTISRPVRRASLPPGDRGHAAWLALAAVGALAVAGAALWARGEGPARPAPPAGATPAPEPPAPRPAASQHTRLTVMASPADARIFVDGVPVVVNPYTAAVPLDGKKHEVRAEAAGFVSQTKLVEFEPSGTALKFALEREGRGGKGESSPEHGPGKPPSRGGAEAPEQRLGSVGRRRTERGGRDASVRRRRGAPESARISSAPPASNAPQIGRRATGAFARQSLAPAGRRAKRSTSRAGGRSRRRQGLAPAGRTATARPPGRPNSAPGGRRAEARPAGRPNSAPGGRRAEARPSGRPRVGRAGARRRP